MRRRRPGAHRRDRQPDDLGVSRPPRWRSSRGRWRRRAGGAGRGAARRPRRSPAARRRSPPNAATAVSVDVLEVQPPAVDALAPEHVDGTGAAGAADSPGGVEPQLRGEILGGGIASRLDGDAVFMGCAPWLSCRKGSCIGRRSSSARPQRHRCSSARGGLGGVGGLILSSRCKLGSLVGGVGSPSSAALLLAPSAPAHLAHLAHLARAPRRSTAPARRCAPRLAAAAAGARRRRRSAARRCAGTSCRGSARRRVARRRRSTAAE